jgi:hypothetical protein
MRRPQKILAGHQRLGRYLFCGAMSCSWRDRAQTNSALTCGNIFAFGVFWCLNLRTRSIQMFVRHRTEGGLSRSMLSGVHANGLALVVAHYRAYILDDACHILKAEVLDAETDDAAAEQAKQLLDGHDIEVWQQQRCVLKLFHRDKWKL